MKYLKQLLLRKQTKERYVQVLQITTVINYLKIKGNTYAFFLNIGCNHILPNSCEIA